MRRSMLVAIPALALGIGGLAAVPGAARQDAGQGAEEFQAGFHTGSCEEPSARPVAELAAVGPQQTDEGETAGEDDIVGTLTAPPILQGSGTAEIALEDLLGDPHVLAVRDGDDVAACGEVGGVLAGNQITLALRPVGDSDYAGVAALGASDDDGTAGTVILFAEVDAFADEDDEDEEAGRQRTPRAGGQGGQAGGGQATGGQATGGQATGGRATRVTGTGGQDVSGGVSGPVIAPPASGGGGGGEAAATEAPTDGATVEPTERARRTRTPRDRETPVATETAPVETATAPAATEVPPAETEVPPAETEVPPAETEVPPAETEVPPPAETEVPPPAETEVPPVASPTA